jgi:hypothetical protein
MVHPDAAQKALMPRKKMRARDLIDLAARARDVLAKYNRDIHRG